MKAHHHRAPVRPEVRAMEQAGKNPNENYCENLQQHYEQIRLRRGFAHGGGRGWILFPELAALSDDVN